MLHWPWAAALLPPAFPVGGALVHFATAARYTANHPKSCDVGRTSPPSADTGATSLTLDPLETHTHTHTPFLLLDLVVVLTLLFSDRNMSDVRKTSVSMTSWNSQILFFNLLFEDREWNKPVSLMWVGEDGGEDGIQAVGVELVMREELKWYETERLQVLLVWRSRMFIIFVIAVSSLLCL